MTHNLPQRGFKVSEVIIWCDDIRTTEQMVCKGLYNEKNIGLIRKKMYLILKEGPWMWTFIIMFIRALLNMLLFTGLYFSNSEGIVFFFRPKHGMLKFKQCGLFWKKCFFFEILSIGTSPKGVRKMFQKILTLHF